MSRYIEYEPLMAELERDVELADDWNTAHEIANVVKYAPTIDAVSVVRCKDCKYHNTHRCFMAFDMVVTEDNGYCYMGERKDHE